MPEIVVRWCACCWGVIGGRKFHIFGVAGLDTPIWDVLAPQDKQEGATEHLCMCPSCLVSQLGKLCQLDLLGLSFAPGLVGLGFSWKKNCI